MEAGIRRAGTLLYLVEPNATTFQHADQVPDYINEAVPLFIILALLEFAVRWVLERPNRMNEAFSNVGIGILHEAVRLLLSGAELFGYEWLYKYRLWDLPWDSIHTWLAAFVLVDFCYYWVHRANHELNILWAVHQVHHSSEDFNLTTGFRLSMFQKLAHFGFYQPLALLGIPFPAVLVHTALNYVVQFWVHSNFIGNLGPLQWVIATPSHHRVHHGANKWCLDKNYASVFVLWDQLFGTFELERQDTEIVYGLTQQPQTHNSVWHQFFYFGEVFRKARSMSTWTDSMKAVFYGPGWSPGTPRLGDPDLFPDVTAPRTKYDPQVPHWQLLYIASHLAVTFLMQQMLLTRFSTTSWVTVLVLLSFIVASVAVVTAMLDGRWWAGPAEVVRCTLYVINARFSYSLNIPALDATIIVFFAACAIFWTCRCLARSYSIGKKNKLR